MRILLHPARTIAFCAVLGFAGQLLAQTGTADPVEALRQGLMAPTRSAEQRDQAIAPTCHAIRGISDLRRALVLQEWRDTDADTEIARIDRRHRAALLAQMEQAVRHVLSQGDATGQIAVIDMIADLGCRVRGVGTSDGLARGFSGDLARLVREGATPVREAAARALGKINPDPDAALPALAGLLASEDASQRHVAATTLANIMKVSGQLACAVSSPTMAVAHAGDVGGVGRAVLPVAGRALTDASPLVRRRAAEAMGWAATAASAQVTESRPTDDMFDPAGHRQQLAEERARLEPFLVALKDQGPSLAQALGDNDPQVRALVRRTLEVLADARLQWLKRYRSEAASDAPALLCPLDAVFATALPALSEGLGLPDRSARLTTVNIMETLGPVAAPAAPALVKVLADPDRFVRWAAARTLGKIAPHSADVAVPALATLLSDGDLDLRLAALEALGHHGPAAASAAPLLIQMLCSTDATDARLAAARVLEKIGSCSGPVAVPALIACLSDADFQVRHTAAEVLGRFGPAARPAVDALRQAGKDSHPAVRQAATEALLQITTAN